MFSFRKKSIANTQVKQHWSKRNRQWRWLVWGAIAFILTVFLPGCIEWNSLAPLFTPHSTGNTGEVTAIAASSQKQELIPIRFTLKEPGFVTLAIEDQQGKRVRNLISETFFPAGSNVAYWDGLDDIGRDTDAAKRGVYHIPGKAIAPGTYRVRGLYRPQINLHYEMTAYTNGNPPWQTADNSGEWLANHTAPSAVLFVPEGAAPKRSVPKAKGSGGQVLVGSRVSEGGSGLAWLDLNGRKLHGQLWVGGVWTGATHLARDNGTGAANKSKSVPGVYAYTASTWDNELRLHELLSATNRTDAPKDTRFGTGEDRPVLTPNFKLPDEKSAELGGLAVNNGLLIASLTKLNQLLLVDAAAHKTLGSVPLDDPRGLAFDRQGRLLALSGRQLLQVELNTNPVKLSAIQVIIAQGLSDPQQMTFDDQGNIYISDRGDSHQVKVFSPQGKFLRAIGDAGKPAVGRYNPNHMNNPNGITISSDGHLWVAETDKTPKRVSIWTLDGKLYKAFYGPPQYGGGGSLDPLDKTRFFYAEEGGMELKLDWDKGTSEPVSLYYRPETDILGLPSRMFVDSRPPETPIHLNGKTYLTDAYNTSPTNGTSSAAIWLLRNGVAVPAAVIGQASDWNMFGVNGNFSVRWSGFVQPKYSETYTFSVVADDGVRLWVNGQIVIDKWEDASGKNQGTIALKAGSKYEIKMEYFNKGGSAIARLIWSSPSQPEQAIPTSQLYSSATSEKTGNGLKAEYFAHKDLKDLKATQTDSEINFDWGIVVPQPLLAKSFEAFKARLPADSDLTKDRVLFAWSDLNSNALPEPDEVTTAKGETLSVNVMPDLSIVTGKAMLFKPHFTPDGIPIYDATKGTTLVAHTQTPTSSGGGQALLGKDGWTVLTVAPKPYAPESIGGAYQGQAMWSYPSLWPGLHASHTAPMPDHPGMLLGTTRLLGTIISPRGSDAGEIWAILGNKGNVYLFTTDGLFVATLFQDSRTASWSNIPAQRGMLVNDVSIGEENFWPSIAQSADGQIYLVVKDSSIVRVEGLEGIRRLPTRSLKVTPEMLQAAQASFKQTPAQQQQSLGQNTLTVAMRQTPPTVDGKLDDWEGANWVKINTGVKQSEAAIAVSSDRLYAAFKTNDPQLLNNSGESLQNLFASGGAIDLMLGTDANADPKRNQAVTGDTRLLVARVKGKTVAVLYRPVVPGTITEPISFSSPQRTVKFDQVEDVSDRVTLATVAQTTLSHKIEGNYEFSIGLDVIGLKPANGQVIRGDVGVLNGNGFQTLQRVYWSNKASGLTSDVPSEAELTPQLWGNWEFKPAD